LDPAPDTATAIRPLTPRAPPHTASHPARRSARPRR
jgi:hypothetical protein